MKDAAAKQFSWQAGEAERDEMEVDVLVVGAGAAGLSCAIEAKRALDRAGQGSSQVLVLEKAEDIGYHVLSGAVMDPRGIAELFPDWLERGCPVESPVVFDCLDVLRPGGKKLRLQGALVPPAMHNHGNYVVSLYKVVRWLKEQAETLGIDVFPGFAAAEILFDGARVVGVQTKDSGLDKSGSKRGGFQPGMNVRAKVTVFAEGTRGNLAKHLIQRLELQPASNPQTYGTGIKELWEIPAARGQAMLGHVIHTAGYPLDAKSYGGGWIYGQKDNRLSLGFVVGLNHTDARLDPHALFVQWKQHPKVAELLAGGKVVRYGAKTLPYGGYFAMPRLFGDGFVLVGDTAGYLNSARLKGIHLAIKSGRLAAEAIAAALAAGDTGAARLGAYAQAFERSWARDELWSVRNFHQAFEGGIFSGAVDVAFQMVTKGRGLRAKRPSHPDYATTQPVSRSRLVKPAFNDTDAMDKLTDVYWSGAIHDEHQPSHLLVTDPSVCFDRCTKEFGNPCQHFCPAAVYEWPAGHARTAGSGPVINASNCLHCKTCDIADPYQVIQWVVPEAGGGPKYIDM